MIIMSKKHKGKQSKLLIVFIILLLIVAIGFLLYPTVSRISMQKTADGLTEDFDKKVDKLKEVGTESPSEGEDKKEDTEDGSSSGGSGNQTGTYISEGAWSGRTEEELRELMSKLYEDSVAYNNRLKLKQDFTEPWEYAALDLSNYGIYDDMYGYVNIPSIDVNLPIYLGATEWNMAYGVTHLYNTSLPIGGESTNCVLSGHTGYIGRYFFDGLPNLEEGDRVYIKTYFGELEYKVVDYHKAIASDTDEMYIDKGKDKLTLFTCADWGKVRYVVVCERVD